MKQQRDLFSIHIATYEGNIVGLYGNLQKLDIKYSFNASPGSIKSIETGGKYLFVSSYDESIRIYDARKFREIGLLEGHSSTILQMKNHKNMLYSSSDEGKILVWKHGDWALIKTFKENKVGVNDIFIDDSGRIMLSISKDNRLFIWNLINVQKAYQRRFSYNLFKILMIEYTYICLLSDHDVHVLTSSDNKEYKVINHVSKLTDMVIFNKYLLTSDEKGYMYFWDLYLEDQEAQPKHIKFQAHENRIKKMIIAKIDNLDLIITCTSNGEIKIWDILYLLNNITQIKQNEEISNKIIKPIYQILTNHRITTMSFFANSEYERKFPNIQLQDRIKNEEKAKLEQVEKKKKKLVKKIKNKIQNNKDFDVSLPQSILKKSKKIKKSTQEIKKKKKVVIQENLEHNEEVQKKKKKKVVIQEN